MGQRALMYSPMKHYRFLLIEDSEFDQRRIARAVSQARNVSLDTVDSISGAREYLSRNRVDLILLDNRLPDGAGIEYAAELSQSSLADIPVMMVSDWPSPFMFDKAMAARVRMVLSKDEFSLSRAVDVLKSTSAKLSRASSM